MKKYLLNGCALLGLLMLAGCMTPIGVNQVSPRQAYRHLNQNALNSDHCSADTIRVLHRYDLDEAFESNPDATLKRLQAIAYADDRRDLLYALSELNYRNADRQRRSVQAGRAPTGAQQLFCLGHLRLSFLVWSSRRAPAESVRSPLSDGRRHLQSWSRPRLGHQHECAGRTRQRPARHAARRRGRSTLILRIFPGN